MAEVGEARVGKTGAALMVLAIVVTIAVALWGINELGRVRHRAETWGEAMAERAGHVEIVRPGVRAVLSAGGKRIERDWDRADIDLPENGRIDPELPAGPWQADITITFDAGPVSSATLGASFSGCSFILVREGNVLLADASEGEPRQRMTIEPASFPTRFAVIRFQVNGDGATPAHFRALWQPEEASEASALP